MIQVLVRSRYRSIVYSEILVAVDYLVSELLVADRELSVASLVVMWGCPLASQYRSQAHPMKVEPLMDLAILFECFSSLRLTLATSSIGTVSD